MNDLGVVQKMPVFWIGLVVLGVAVVIFAVPTAKSAFGHNMDMRYYAHLMFAAEGLPNSDPATVADSLLQRNEQVPSLLTECRVEKLLQYAADPTFESDWLRADLEQCQPVTPVGRGEVTFPIVRFSQNRPIVQRSNQQLEFRRNSSLWGPIYVHDPGSYRLMVEARAVGPAPALLDVHVASEEAVLAYGNTTETKSLDLMLPTGVHWIELTYINDGSLHGVDRNLRLVSVRIVPHDD